MVSDHESAASFHGNFRSISILLSDFGISKEFFENPKNCFIEFMLRSIFRIVKNYSKLPVFKCSHYTSRVDLSVHLAKLQTTPSIKITLTRQDLLNRTHFDPIFNPSSRSTNKQKVLKFTSFRTNSKATHSF